MRKILVLLFAIVSAESMAQHRLSWAWATDTSLRTPESVLFDPVDNCLWVSCINGQPTVADSNGTIAQLRTDGRIIDREWVTGLHAPKGMARVGKKLFVTDISALVVIDIYNRKIEQKVSVEGAAFLNDVTATEDGTIYISDMSTGKVHMWKDGKMTVFLEGLSAPNGLLAVGDALYILASGTLHKYQAGKLTKIAGGMEASTDGLVMVKPGEFVVSCWNGVIYHVNSAGKVTQMLDTRKRNSNTADIGFDPKTQTVLVPTFFKNSVVGYRLE